MCCLPISEQGGLPYLYLAYSCCQIRAVVLRTLYLQSMKGGKEARLPLSACPPSGQKDAAAGQAWRFELDLDFHLFQGDQ